MQDQGAGSGWSSPSSRGGSPALPPIRGREGSPGSSPVGSTGSPGNPVAGSPLGAASWGDEAQQAHLLEVAEKARKKAKKCGKKLAAIEATLNGAEELSSEQRGELEQ